MGLVVKSFCCASGDGEEWSGIYDLYAGVGWTDGLW